jgi:hypothetical protein
MYRALSLLLLLLTGAGARGDEARKVRLHVEETAGIRRFGYPVHVTFALPAGVTEKERFRLLAGGKPVAAQFRVLAGAKKTVALDFTVSMGPLQKKDYTVEFGPKVEAGPEPKGGVKLEREKGTYTVRSGGMAYVIDPAYRWLRSVRSGKKEYLRPGEEIKAEDRPAIKVLREGPLAICLRVQGKSATSGHVDFTFPRSKSWVECVLTVDDPEGVIPAFLAEFPLVLKGKTALVDFGAASVVYTTLRKDQHAVLSAGGMEKHAWMVCTGDEKTRNSPFVLPAPGSTTPAEGWAHVMDSERCTALAVEDFGKGVKDTIQVDGSGKVNLWRHFRAGSKGRKTYRFWLHFVDMPVQVGALTSPQSMMAPLKVMVVP